MTWIEKKISVVSEKNRKYKKKTVFHTLDIVADNAFLSIWRESGDWVALNNTNIRGSTHR